MNRVPINAIEPRAIQWLLDSPVTLPNSAVALKPTPKRYLPNPVSLSHPPFGLDVSHLVPERGRRSVAEPVEGHPGGLDVLGGELEVLLELVNDGAAARVDAEVLERLLEVGDVWFPFFLEDFAAEEGEEE